MPKSLVRILSGLEVLRCALPPKLISSRHLEHEHPEQHPEDRFPGPHSICVDTIRRRRHRHARIPAWLSLPNGARYTRSGRHLKQNEVTG
jgi:hypothetical protein